MWKFEHDSHAGDAVLSHPSPSEFPANREFYREIDDFGGPETYSVAKNRCAAATFEVIPYSK